MINSNLRLITSDIIGENGILLFYGIDKNGYDIKEMFVPPNPITEFYYVCTRKFEIERFKTLFESKPIGHVIFISGIECLIYQYNGIWKKIKSITANLIKRHHMGGQSALRFSRLAEESRTHYITHIIDWINKLIIINKNNYVFGSRELKNKLLESKELKIKLKTEDCYHIFNNDTIKDDYFTKLLSNIEFKNSNKINEIVTLLEKDPDYLLFSDEEIQTNIDNVEYIVIIKPNKKYNKETIILPENHPMYKKLMYFQVIGKLYHKDIVYFG